MKDMLHELMSVLAKDSDILKIKQTGGLKSYKRREELGEDMTSITVIPKDHQKKLVLEVILLL
ncbi:hypothetical protein ACN9TB_01005 [Lactococcus lactis]